MANVLQHHIDFHPRPVSHAPSPFGFGFGLGPTTPSSMTPTGWQVIATTGHSAPQLGSSGNYYSAPRVQKRRHDPEDDVEAGKHAGLRDDSMDRSPTPERLKRAPPKRAKIAPPLDTPKGESMIKENKTSSNNEDSEVDVGLLLASLPSQMLLPLLTSLLNAQPSLKSTILPLIPRPTLETAIQALALSAKKLRDAYPYSTFLQSPASTTSSLGRQSLTQNASAFGPTNHVNYNSGMRDSYIISRLRPFITEFVSTCFSYLPYFTSIPAQTPTFQTTSASHQQPQSHSTILQSAHKDKSNPTETFLFLSAVTNHILTQMPLAQSSLVPLLLPRLSEEWNAWVCRVDEIVNRQGGMFGSETVRTWERTLDELADAKGFEGSNIMRSVRDLWVSKVGWLTGRTIHQQMEEL